MLTMRVDGRDVILESSKWSVYEATRRGRLLLAGGRTLRVTTQLRMAWNDSALLWKVTLENDRPQPRPETQHTSGTMAVNATTPAPTGSPSSSSTQHQDFALAFEVQVQARQQASMGWLIFDPPHMLTEFKTEIRTAGEHAMVLHQDSESDAVSGFAFADRQPDEWRWRENRKNQKASVARGLINVALSPGQSVSLQLVAAMDSTTAAGGVDGMAQRLDGYAARFNEHFVAAKTEWERVWNEAFTPPAARPTGRPQLFSGHLPVLRTDDAAIRRLYYMGALSLLATGRTSVTAFNDGPGAQTSFVTGFGNSCWTGDDEDDGHSGGDKEGSAEVDCRRPAYPRDTTLAPVYIGATAQFYWDTSLRALLTSLLDSAALRRYILKMMAQAGDHFQRSFGLDALNGEPIGYEYAFNAHSVFTIVATYLRATNDTALLAEVVAGGDTIDQRLEGVALDWVGLRLRLPNGTRRPTQSSFLRGTPPPSSLLQGEEEYFFLADYGANLAHFLECLPTYIHATPGLQGGIAEKMAWMASLRAAQGNTTGAEVYRDLAGSVAVDAVQQLYVPGGNGTWGCLYPDNKLVAVRHVLDFIYVTRGLDRASRVVAAELDAAAAPQQQQEKQQLAPTPFLPAHVAQEMAAFFHRELEMPTWIRALSLEDELNLKVPRPQLILRPDHGITGAFDAWAALAAEALALNEGDWKGALALLRHMSEATKEGPFGQAHELDGSTDEATTFKTIRGWTRFTADNGASFSDVIVRGLFGYDPPFLAPRDPNQKHQGLESAIDGANQARGDLQATLENLATPWGVATLQVDGGGVRIQELT